MRTILIFLLAALPAFAGEIPRGVIEVNPKIYRKKDFRKHRSIRVRELGPAGVPHPQALPDKERREAVFARVPGLEKYTGKMDELDRDLLYMRARHGTEPGLREKNPDIPEEILRKLVLEAGKP